MPGMRLAAFRWVRPVGSASITSAPITRCRDTLRTSTTGVSPLTVIVSLMPPTRSSALIVAANAPVNSMPSRFKGVNPPSENVTA